MPTTDDIAGPFEPKLAEIRAQKAVFAAEIATLAESENLDDAGEARWTDINADYEALVAQEQRAEARAAKYAEVRAAAAQGGAHLEDGDGARRTGPTVIKRAFNDPFDMAEVRSRPGSNEWRRDLVDRVSAAVEQRGDHLDHFTDAQRESTLNAVRKDSKRKRTGGRLAEFCLLTGSEKYHRAFESYVESFGQFIDPAVQSELRTAMSLTGANGGFLVPFTLDPTIILTNTGATDPFRQMSRVETITTDDWNGVSSAGVTAEWLGENTEAADATPTFAQPSISVHKGAAYLFGSYEVLADSGFASEVSMLIADARERLEAAAHATGSGSGQPFGIVTALGLTTASRVAGSSGAAGAATLTAADVYALASALPPRYRNRASWVAEFTTINGIRQLATGTGPQHAFIADLAMDQPPLLLGKPLYEASGVDSTIVSGSNDDVLIVGDFSNYVLVDRVGLTLLYDPLVLGSNRRPQGSAGWFAFFRHGADSVNDDAFRMLRL